MAVPKRKLSKSRRDTRRNSHWKLSLPGLAKCSQCGAARLPHRVCMQCGNYNGKEVIKIETKEEK